MINKIKNLVDTLNKAADAYYNTGSPTMSDKNFDNLLSQLSELEKTTGFVMSNSPTQRVGAEVKTRLNKVQHTRPMLSLDKCHEAQDLINFAEDDDCYLSVKCDGLTTRLIYEDGSLIGAETRGDGEVGQDVLFHIKTYINVPMRIPVEGRFVIDGESVIFYSDFEKINHLLPENERFANPRNLASGTLSNLDANITKQRNMRFIAWRVIEGDTSDSHFCRLRNAEKLGFTLPPMYTYTNKSDDKNNIDVMLHSLRGQANIIGLPMDGIVMAKDSDKKSESMGRTSKFFRHSIAYKFEDESYETKLECVDWTLGKSGILTPTAVFKSVSIDGSEVSRASLHNLTIMKNLGITNHCTVKVFKANCIIPQISECYNDGDGVIVVPSKCPVCNGATAIRKDNESEVLICVDPNCIGKQIAKLTHFVSKKAMSIDGMSESTISFLVNKGWVKSFNDIYHLRDHKTEWQMCDGFGKKSVEKILESIEKSRNVKLDAFITALGIEGIGSSAAKTIAEYCEYDVYALFDADDQMFDWTQLDDIGPTMSKNIYKFFGENFSEVFKLAKELHFVKPEKKVMSDNVFAGKSLCVTGKLNHFTRDSINEKLASLGAKAASSVSKKTDWLITNESSGSSKYKKAVELGIPIITEDEFLAMIGE